MFILTIGHKARLETRDARLETRDARRETRDARRETRVSDFACSFYTKKSKTSFMIKL